ncbi:hypothetical protein [Acetobacterium woodii]|nr:hypothetical protein [Acetobacterium woodii]
MNDVTLDSGFITDSVPTAVWLSTLINTYYNIKIMNKNDCWITQKEIRTVAGQLCDKNIDIARISQWCNGDHPNNTYNYLRANGSKRRLTVIGEFNREREYPDELPINKMIFNDSALTVGDLMTWYKNEYCRYDFSKDDIVSKDYYLKNIKVGENKPVKTFTEVQILEKVEKQDDKEMKDYPFFHRIINIVNNSWEVFENKVGYEDIFINKEASMQLHFAHILQQYIPLIIYERDESATVELETAVDDGMRIREADIMITAYKGIHVFRVVIELKCYKTKASSGGPRGAQDIFMKEVYQDIELVEKYLLNDQADEGFCFVMTDHRMFVYPRQKNGKCWDYDMSQGTVAGNTILETPIGGKDTRIELKKEYVFNWNEIGEYYFLKLQAQKQNELE